jgi:hypothetical protein
MTERGGDKETFYVRGSMGSEKLKSLAGHHVLKFKGQDWQQEFNG